uniref:Lectin 2 n=1 Tax=Cyclocybe aegerita TaxID=1973307 RepID=UPI00063FD389|nr:Chain A, Lectin 2 [Cyclocybe aegerita]4TQJ_B Chain B, Lectin 2 [Cyclocybe aegerita]4TQK_A Chain A, Lectin 2 [Cyclocybe aegerita]4TQK_B Chain B, Lectin 2 [Cyclocybe aegerita]4TQM_A Chain A, Lectin 2 [Cyclocybe aegerita]
TSNVITQDLPIPVASRGFADIVGFGLDGVVIGRNAVNLQPFLAVKNFAQNAGGWLTTKHVRLIADTTGTGKGDIVGFGNAGVYVSVNNGKNTFADPPKMVIANFGYDAGGWRVEKHLRYLADIRKTGRADIIGFGEKGVLVSRNNGGLNFGPATLVLKDFGYDAGGWRLDRHLRFLADVTGNGHLDIVGFGDKHVFISRNNGDGTFAPAKSVIDNFCIDAGGWKIGDHPRFVADLTGDGTADIIGCGKAGCWVALNNGGGVFGQVKLVINDFGTDKGWQAAKHPRFIADLTGNGRGDVVGFGNAGVYVALNNGDGTFQSAKLVLKDFGVQQGWTVSKHRRFVVDLTGDGCADIIGFGEKETLVSYNDGKGNFGPVKALTNDFSFSGGKWAPETTVCWMANLDSSRH